MRVLKIISIAVVLSFNSSCYYDVEELLYPDIECDKSDMSYSLDIAPILIENCYSCHDNVVRFGNVILNSHSEVIKHVNSSALLGAISHSPGFSPMPQNSPKLLACEIEKIDSWIQGGAPNN